MMDTSVQQPDLFSGIADVRHEYQRLNVSPQQQELLCRGGAEYIPDFITDEEERILLSAIDQESWNDDLRRRVQHYGYRYDYSKRTVNAEQRLGELPDWAHRFAERLVEQSIFTTPPSQLIVNEYQPGQGIAPHSDRDGFGPVVASLSLASDCMMKIIPDRKDRQTAFEIVLQRRSLLVLKGDSRYVWQHGIEPKRNDRQNHHVFPRNRRVSLTFRTVNDSS